ncbi:MAG: hypothetical protein FJ297_06135 [Planctomycetes bacterium]|nr:hypothetical protein [Planctomycetota bacterium]
MTDAFHGRTALCCFLATLLVAIAIRSAAIGLLRNRLDEDPDSYAVLAEQIARFGTFGFAADRPTAYRPPLYPLTLSLMAVDGRVSRAAVGGLHIALGAFAAGGTWVLASRWIGSTRAATCAGILVAVDPLLINQSVLVMTETLATALVVAVLLLADAWRRRPRVRSAIPLGAALALGVLCRPTFLAWVPCVFVWMAFGDSAASWRMRIRRVGPAAIGFLIVMAPWWIRNAARFGEFIATTTHGGYTLLLANNDSFYDHLAARDENSWDASSLDPLVRRLERDYGSNDAELDRAHSRLAWTTMARRPAMAVWSAARREVELWNPMPRAVEGRWSSVPIRAGIAAWYVLQFAMAIRGLFALRGRSQAWSAWGPAWALGLVLVSVHSLYWTNARMRAPFEPVIALAAALGGLGACRPTTVRDTCSTTRRSAVRRSAERRGLADG